MKILISPAKTLDYETELPTSEFSRPRFFKQAKIINNELKSKTPSDLQQLMDISNKLAELNWQRNKKRKLTAADLSETHRQALYAFKGEVYLGLDAYSIDKPGVEFAQERLRILSGLYGLLRPLDLIEPYRLEMGTAMAVGEHKNLYDFWKPVVTKTLNKELKKSDLVVNLASQEYFAAIDIKTLKGRLITPEFRDFKNGKLTMISFFAKKARGMMVRHIIDTRAESVDDLKLFNSDGYAYSEHLSDNTKLVFTR